MKRKRFTIEIKPEYVRPDDVIGLFKGIAKSDAKIVGISEFPPRSITFSVKHGFEDIFKGQIESYIWKVKHD